MASFPSSLLYVIMAFWSFLYRIIRPLSLNPSASPSSSQPEKKETTKVRASNGSITKRQPPPSPPPEKQRVLLLHAPRQPYTLTEQHPVPLINTDHEILVRVKTIGLNPIDWKAPDFNFGIPQLPYISGRDLVGEVIQAPKQPSSRLRVGDLVIVISTDYRDLRKGAYQEYVVTSTYNACRLPPSLSTEAGASLGVAFVASVLALGVCLGIDFSRPPRQGPNLPSLIRSLSPTSLPEDIRNECTNGVPSSKFAPHAGDWIAIWGGSSTTADLATQLAKFAGLRVISVVDVGKHGAKMSAKGADLLVDSHDADRAVDVIRAVTGGKLRFGIDTKGRDTAIKLLGALKEGSDAEEVAEETAEGQGAHLVGLTGLPKQPRKGVRYHAVPIKLFHEVHDVGEALMIWLEKLLQSGDIRPPEVLGVEKGLEGVNLGLERMRKGEISGGRLVVNI